MFQAILCRHVGILGIFYSEIDHRVSFFEGISNPLMIQSLEKVRRNEVLIAAKRKGAGLRQLSRLTGVSFGVIQKLSHRGTGTV